MAVDKAWTLYKTIILAEEAPRQKASKMELNDLINEGIVKEESVGYLKSRFKLQQGHIRLTPKTFALHVDQFGIGGTGTMGGVMKKRIQEKDNGFHCALSDISQITHGKNGFNKEVLELHLSNGKKHRITVKSVAEWRTAISEQKKSSNP